MPQYNIHLIHVGNMTNKGSQGLLTSDVKILNDILKNVNLSVSTVDPEGVSRLNVHLDAILNPVVDVPYEKADVYAKQLGYKRANIQYKFLALISLVIMMFQASFSVFSAVAIKIGFKGFYRSKVLNRLKESDLIISCSDEHFKETASYLSVNIYWIVTWWSMLFSRTWDVLVSRYLGKKVVLFPNSIGPFSSFVGKNLAKLALNRFDYILVREAISLGIVDSLKISSPKKLTSDTALLTPVLQNVSNPSPRPVLGICLGIYGSVISDEETKRYTLEYAKSIDDAIDKNSFSVVFLPHYVTGFRYDDFEISNLIISQMRNNDKTTLIMASSVEQFKALLGQMDMVISSKMHPAIFATAQYVPTVCIAYDQKQTGYFNRLGLDECVIPIHGLTKKDMSATIEHVWVNREKIHFSLEAQVPLLVADVKGSIELVVKKALNLI